MDHIYKKNGGFYMKNWKKRLALLSVFVLALGLTACGGNKAADKPAQDTQAKQEEKAGTMKLSTTTSVRDSGLLDAILPDFEKKHGIKVDVIAQGSGAALETGKRGDADALLVHSPKAEKAFMDEGYGKNHKTFMYNFYVIVGPANDPAGIKGMEAGDAFATIAANKGLFASRGDESGTHSKELSLWKGKNIDPQQAMTPGENYLSLGKGMGDTLTLASEKGAYTLTDLATFLSMKDKLKLEVLVDQSDDLKNDYSVIEVNPEKNANVNQKAAQAFTEWITSKETLEEIAKYGNEKYGQPLFFVYE